MKLTDAQVEELARDGFDIFDEREFGGHTMYSETTQSYQETWRAVARAVAERVIAMCEEERVEI